MDRQKTIYEKWEEGEISILPKEKPSKKQIMKRLRDTEAAKEEKMKLPEPLYEDTEIKEKKR